MEWSSNAVVVPYDFGWSDIGSWSAVNDLVAPHDANNCALGDAIFINGCNTFVQGEDRLVATVGVGDLMIIDTPNTILVVHPDNSQDVMWPTLNPRDTMPVRYTAMSLARRVLAPF